MFNNIIQKIIVQDAIIKNLMGRWYLFNDGNDDELSGINKFDVFLEVNFSLIVDVLIECQATEYYYYKTCFEMVNMDLVYKDEYLEFIFNELMGLKDD